MSLLPFVLAFFVSLALVPLVRWLSFRTGKVAQPRKDRWHKKPTPTLGGIGIFAGFVLATLLTGGFHPQTLALLLAAALSFALGLYDDFKRISPPAKLVGQITAAAIFVFAGYQIQFFKFDLLNIGLTFIWLVGITNAINLLDNMDGLAGGISLIVAGFLAYFFFTSGGQDFFLILALALAGGILGFLVFNFPPASIFMGDSGSLFIGFTLAALAVARRSSASNVFAVLGVPTLLFMLPILDTTLVTITRILRGQSPAQGGRDHTSHRLIAFGLTERQVALTLYALALVSGMAGTFIERLAYDFSLFFVPILIVAFALLAAYLGRLQIVPPGANPDAAQKTLTRIANQLAYRQRLLEIALDFPIISVAYYLSIWIQADLSLNQGALDFFLRSLPIALIGSYLAFFAFGVYRGLWDFFGLQDFLTSVRAVFGALLLIGVAEWLIYPPGAYNLLSLTLFGIFLLIGLTASRASFRVFDQIFARSKTTDSGGRVLIYGAANAGEVCLRWLELNPQLGYLPVGFVDDDPLKEGRVIHGVSVLGGVTRLPEMIEQTGANGLILTSPKIAETPNGKHAIALSHARGLWVRLLRLDFEEIEPENDPES